METKAFKPGTKVKIENPSKIYADYASWIKYHFPKYAAQFKAGKLPDAEKPGRDGTIQIKGTFLVIGTAPFTTGSPTTLTLIENSETETVYIVETAALK